MHAAFALFIRAVT